MPQYYSDQKYRQQPEPTQESKTNQAYDPLSKTQLNPYLDVDDKQLEQLYNQELDALEFVSDKTSVASPTPIQSYSGRLDAFVNRDRSKPVTEEQLESVRGPGFAKQNFAKNFKKGGELEEGNPATLDFLPSSLESKHPDVYKKLMGMPGDAKEKLTKYFNTTVSSAQENVTDIKSGLGWFKDLDVGPVQEVLETAGIDKGDFRGVVKDYATEKAEGAGEDFGYGSQIALTTAMRLKGLKRGGALVEKYSQGGDLTAGQQSAVNWSNVASTAVDMGVSLSQESSVFNKDGDPYSERSLGDTRKAAIGERAGKGAKIGGTAGAAIGSVIPVVGTAVGAAVGTAVGAIGGAISGWFGGKKQYEKDQEAIKEREETESIALIGTGNQISDTIAQKKTQEAKGDYLEGILASNTPMKYGGMVKGPRHEQGGVMAVKNGKPIAEVEGDEYIINNDIIKDKKESKNKFRVEGTPAQIASALNSYKGYGDNTNPGGNIYKIG
mgnify:CR=1 FL=1